MRALVLSDTHGLTHELREVADWTSFSAIFHCGDFCCERSELPFTPTWIVRGNCDAVRDVPEEQVGEWGGVRILLTHGHRYRVKETLLPLKYRALEVGANVVLFGHSHVPVAIMEDGVLLVNPGSLAAPRKFPRPTYAVLEVVGKTVQVIYYDGKGKVVEELGGTFHLSPMP
ncbi:MAG: metallophosphoesterase [Calditerricola sp.]|nr:metallophosphoesterase [Calditerricola sp.]